MTLVLIISIIVVIGVLIFTLISINKGYKYKHTVDPLDNNPHLPAATQPEEDNK
ncbi:putative integral membrane protein [Bacillus ectoiniformans]|uniref:YtzI protein n=1 Tax=Bacillus ectoiniformans TaxID=1494429 RepID=UPI0019569314|nr:YtzI protein [Bacillus ectoiniformans]MBM7649723.1 putative integral membrane protein [Bacillus ectoiniformans]